VGRVSQMLASDDPGRQALRTVGGLLLGAGMLLVFIRRSDAFPEPWGDLALLLVLLVPCVFLYGAGMLGARAARVGSSWRGVFLVFGTLLVAPVLFQFLEWIDGDTSAALNVAWIFLLTAIAGAIAASAAGVRYTLLLASLALIVAWLALWDELLTDGVFADVGTLRWLLVAIGAALVLLGAGVRMVGGQAAPARGNELLTGGGLAAVGAGAISFAAVYTAMVPVEVVPAEPTAFWDAYLLVVSVGAILLAASLGVRGLAYVGATGLAIFVLVVGLDLDDDQPAGKVLGWPLIVLVVGAVAFLASLVGGARSRPRPPGGGQL
jgi:hypothetical protein